MNSAGAQVGHASHGHGLGYRDHMERDLWPSDRAVAIKSSST